MTASWAVRVARGGLARLGKPQLVTNSRGTSLKVDGVKLLSSTALLPDLVSKYKKTADAKKYAVRIAVSRAMGWPVTHRLTVPAGAATAQEGDVLTILTPGEVELAVSVDEEDFLVRIRQLDGRDRRRALEAFDLRRR